MKRRLLPLLLLCGLLSPAGDLLAQGRWRDMPPDERRQMRQQMREHWQQDGNFRQDNPPPRWRDVPPEDRRRMREEMRDQRDWQGLRNERGGRGWRND